MARTRGLQDLVADVRWISDTEGATSRHTDRQIVRALNQSVQALRLMISEYSPYYLTSTTTASASATVSLASITDIVAIYGVDIAVSGETRELFPFQFSERNKYESSVVSETGIPTSYRYSGGSLLIRPTPDASYTFTIWYLPTGTDMTATYNADDSIATTSSSFDGIAGWEDWIVYDTAMRISTRDAGVNDNFEVLGAELARIQQRIVNDAKKRTRDKPVRRVDTRGRRIGLEVVNRWRLP